ncbi:MAG: hypothetical protein IPG58_20565 [Acidobacteria bacterium]|nr:hypothetical protein [Acidobacteriota bacterium]
MSSDTNKRKTATPWWFWVFAGLMVLINILGIVQLVYPYLLSEAEKAEQISSVGLEIMTAEPLWATVGYSLGVIGSFLGSVTMLRHRTRRLSRIFFAVSILGLLAQRAWFFLLSGLTHLVPMPVMLLNPVVVALIAIWMVSRALRIAEQSTVEQS